MTAIFQQGNAKDVLKGFPENFFHCAVTSPPYFGLRKYDGGAAIWDGDAKCEHEWVAHYQLPKGGRNLPDNMPNTGGNRVQQLVDSPRFGVHSSFCRRCGAWRGQLGAEPTPDLYISHLVQICQEVKRVLRKDGVFWLNIGDSWCGYKGDNYLRHPESSRLQAGTSVPSCHFVGTPQTTGLKPLDMILIPSQIAIALRADDWYVRSMVVWSKNNPMPESVNGWRWEEHRVSQCPRCMSLSSFKNRVCKICDWRKPSNRGETEAWWAETGQQEHSEDGGFRSDSFFVDCPGCPKCSHSDGYILRKGSWRPTDSYEFILMLTKTNNYYSDREAVLERGVYPPGESRQGGDWHKSMMSGSRTTEGLHNKEWIGNGGRNLRSVWSFPTRPGKFNHYAAYPPRLPETCIRSSTSEKGCCPACGAPWARVVDKGFTMHNKATGSQYAKGTSANRLALLRQSAREQGEEYSHLSRTTGWRPTCSCSTSDLIPCRILDPFSGAGTTALAAERLGLDSFSIDTSAEYIELSKVRLMDDKQKRIREDRRAIKGEK